MSLRELPLPAGTAAEHLGRACVELDDSAPVLVTVGGVEVLDGTLELDLVVSAERSFPGLAWRVRPDAYESFFVRPHQSSKDDAVQYTPVFNDVSGWQLYHGAGFWSPVAIPLDEWFTLRVAFAADRGEAYVGDLTDPALVFSRLRAPALAGGVGILPGGGRVRVGRFAYDATKPTLRGAAPAVEEMLPGVIPKWSVSNLVPEGTAPATARSWTYIASEPSGLTNLARVHPLGMTLNTVFARTTIVSAETTMRSMAFGFSDRAVVYLNGRPIFGGNDDYRSRDYRFLGSAGYWYKLFLPLVQGENELVIAVSETFGGWGVMARFMDPSGLVFRA